MSDDDDFAHGVWVKSDCAPDGTYVASVEYGYDVSHVLTPRTAVEYVQNLMAASATAEYDAAVLAQLHVKLDVPLRAAVETLGELRKDRPQQEWHVGPLTVFPQVHKDTLAPVLGCEVGKLRWLWDLIEVKRHAIQVLEVAPTVDLDAGYRRFLIGHHGLEPGNAATVVDDLLNFRAADVPSPPPPAKSGGNGAQRRQGPGKNKKKKGKRKR